MDPRISFPPLAALAFVGALALPGADANGALVPFDLRQLTARSRFVVCGEVVDLHSSWTDFPALGRVIVTEVRIRIVETWKGAPGGGELTVRYFGGRIGDDWQVCLESPQYTLGEKVLVFAREWKGALWTTGWLQGKFPLVETESGMQVRGRRDLPIQATDAIENVRERVRAFDRETSAGAPSGTPPAASSAGGATATGPSVMPAGAGSSAHDRTEEQ